MIIRLDLNLTILPVNAAIRLPALTLAFTYGICLLQRVQYLLRTLCHVWLYPQ